MRRRSLFLLPIRPRVHISCSLDSCSNRRSLMYSHLTSIYNPSKEV